MHNKNTKQQFIKQLIYPDPIEQEIQLQTILLNQTM